MANATSEISPTSSDSFTNTEGSTSLHDTSVSDKDETFHSILESDEDSTIVNYQDSEDRTDSGIEDSVNKNSKSSDARDGEEKSAAEPRLKKRRSDEDIELFEAAKKPKQEEDFSEVFLISSDYFDDEDVPELPTVDQETPVKRKRRRKKKKIIKKEVAEKEQKKEKKMIRPNYFVGIKVSNPQIHGAVRLVQEHILREEQLFRSTFVSVPTLHLTLLVSHLAGPADIQKACDALRTCAENFKDSFYRTPILLQFKGISTFGNEVLFANIERGENLERLQKFADEMETTFKECGVDLPSKKGFKPHLTIMKLSKDSHKLRRKGLGKIPKRLYADMKDMTFGVQVVKSVQLLAMNKKKDEKGYYQCEHEFDFGVTCNAESDDHSECCGKPLSVVKAPNLNKSKEQLNSYKFEVKRRFHTMALERLQTLFDKSSTDEEASDKPTSAETAANLLKSLMIVGAVGITILSIYQRLLPHGK